MKKEISEHKLILFIYMIISFFILCSFGLFKSQFGKPFWLLIILAIGISVPLTETLLFILRIYDYLRGK